MHYLPIAVCTKRMNHLPEDPGEQGGVGFLGGEGSGGGGGGEEGGQAGAHPPAWHPALYPPKFSVQNLI